MKSKKNKIALKIIGIIAVALTFLSFLKGILISLDIDESYAVAVGYRLARGDRLVKDMWEPHQFSAFLTALLTMPYIYIRGNVDYLVIYLRIAGALIHIGFGLVLYWQLSKTLDKLFVFGLLLLHLNYLPKWVQMPEFELMHYWCLLGIFLTLYMYFTGGKHKLKLTFFGGVFLSGSILCYPTMIILYPVYILGIYILERQHYESKGWKAWWSCLSFTFGTALTGAGFLVYLFSYMSLEAFGRYISYIFLDTSHGIYTMGEKWTMYFEQLLEQGNDYKVYFGIAVGIVLSVCLVYRFATHGKWTNRREKVLLVSDAESAIIITMLITALLMQIVTIYAYLFLDKNQFFFQARYMALLLPAVILGVHYPKRMAIWFYLCILPGFMSIPAVLFITNMDTNVTYAKAFLAVLGSFLILYQYIKEIVKTPFWKKFFSVIQYALGGMVLAGLLVCRLLLIRVTGCLPVTIRAPLEKMENGAAAGIYILADTAEIWNDNYREIKKYVSQEDKLLYIGAESLIYADTGAFLSTPSTQGTAIYNEMYLYYYEEHPERIPDVVVFDKTFGENPAYFLYYSFSLQSGVLFDWVEEYYSNGQIVETDHMIILRKK